MPGATATEPGLSAARHARRELVTWMVEVEAAAARPVGVQEIWIAGIQRAVENLILAFERHVEATESETGLYHDVLERTPRLAHRVEHLQAEHETLRDVLEAVLSEIGTAGRTPEDVRVTVLKALGKLSRHRQAGADLVWESFGVDIGGND